MFNNPMKTIVSAQNATIYNDDGSTHIDLLGANGTILLGHCHPSVVKELAEQSQKVWITGRLNTNTRLLAKELVEKIIPQNYYVSGFYSTGMEAAEFALRASRVLTRRKNLVGFDQSMHGKSMATAYLAWPNDYGYPQPGFVRLPFPSTDQSDNVLKKLEMTLSQKDTAAVFLEPIQGSGGGAVADRNFCQSLTDLCKKYETLLIVDEILTGFYRTGSLFFHSRLPLDPDIILIGKCIGNGFPVSAVLMRRDLETHSKMLPFSTYAENSLAAAAIIGTLGEMRKLPIETMANSIDRTINLYLHSIVPDSFNLSIYGAFCIMDTRDPAIAKSIADDCYLEGLIISQAGSVIRLFPPITIEGGQLEKALNILNHAIIRNCSDSFTFCQLHSLSKTANVHSLSIT